jgi:hypothetical protein
VYLKILGSKLVVGVVDNFGADSSVAWRLPYLAEEALSLVGNKKAS